MAKSKQEVESKAGVRTPKYGALKVILLEALESVQKARAVLLLAAGSAGGLEVVSPEESLRITEQALAADDGAGEFEQIRARLLRGTPAERRNEVKRETARMAADVLALAVRTFREALTADLNNSKADIALDRIATYGGRDDIEVARTMISMADLLDSDEQPDPVQVAASRMKSHEAAGRRPFNPAKDY